METKKKAMQQFEGLTEAQLLETLCGIQAGDAAILQRVSEWAGVSVDAFKGLPMQAVIAKHEALIQQDAENALAEAAFGSPAAQEVVERTLKRLYGTEQKTLAVAREQMTGLRKELAGPGATALETLMAERVATCQLHLDAVEWEYAKALNEGDRQALQKRVTQAHNRFVSAVKGLASVKKMKLPDVQVNIGEKQINIAGAGTQQRNAALAAREAPSLPAGATFIVEEDKRAAIEQKHQ